MEQIPSFELSSRKYELPEKYEDLIDFCNSSSNENPFDVVEAKGHFRSIESSSLKFLHLNVMMDQWKNSPYALHSEPALRYHRIVQCFGDYDLVFLNEVTRSFMGLLATEKEICKQFFISESTDGTTFGGNGNMGNVVLVKKGLVCVPRFFKIFLPAVPRPAVVLMLSEKSCICCCHLTALNMNVERRRNQLHFLIETVSKKFESVMVVGDLNFHNERDDTSVPEGFVDHSYSGYSFNALINDMHKVLWPLGFESRQMKLDRVLTCGPSFGVEGLELAFTEPLFGDRKTFSDSFFNRCLWQTGWNLPDAKDYLFASDHFGLKGTLLLKKNEQDLHSNL